MCELPLSQKTLKVLLEKFSETQVYIKSPEWLFKTIIAGTIPRGSDFRDQEWGLRICISNRFPGDAAGLGTTLCEPLT